MIGKLEKILVCGDKLSKLAFHQSVVFDNALYIVMGFNGTTDISDVYKTYDGITFTKQSIKYCDTNTPIKAMDYFGLCELNGKVYMFGGLDIDSNHLNTVYVTSNMVSWQKMVNAQWTARMQFAFYVLDNYAYVVGGTDGSYLNEVWKTGDFVNWEKLPDAPFSARRSMGYCVFQDKMYVIGGIRSGGVRLKDIWRTSNGIEWENVSYIGSLPNSELPVIKNIDDTEIVHTGGRTGLATSSDKIFHCANPSKWDILNNSMGVGGIYGHTINEIDRKNILVGGVVGNTTYSDNVYQII